MPETVRKTCTCKLTPAPEQEGTPKTVSISHEADSWYVCFLCADVPAQPLLPTGRATGIDGWLTVFLFTSSGDTVENSRHHRKAKQHLKKAQRRVSRRNKAVTLLAKKHRQVKRQRADRMCVAEQRRARVGHIA